MSVVYATLIVNGKKEFKDVPARIKDQVRQVLIDLDLEELAVEQIFFDNNTIISVNDKIFHLQENTVKPIIYIVFSSACIRTSLIVLLNFI